MRDAKDIKNAKVEAGGKRGKIVGFWITEAKVIYAKIKDYKGITTNYKLTELPADISLVHDEDEPHLFI